MRICDVIIIIIIMNVLSEDFFCVKEIDKIKKIKCDFDLIGYITYLYHISPSQLSLC